MRTHAQEKTKHAVFTTCFVFSCASFQTAPYPFKPAVGVVEGSALHCGYLTVPAEHSRPQGPTIRLAVAIFKASYSNPAPDPVVYLEGGPEGPVLAHLAHPHAEQHLQRLAGDHDLILVDQRGLATRSPRSPAPSSARCHTRPFAELRSSPDLILLQFLAELIAMLHRGIRDSSVR